jgi:hypothetical protein
MPNSLAMTSLKRCAVKQNRRPLRVAGSTIAPEDGSECRCARIPAFEPPERRLSRETTIHRSPHGEMGWRPSYTVMQPCRLPMSDFPSIVSLPRLWQVDQRVRVAAARFFLALFDLAGVAVALEIAGCSPPRGFFALAAASIAFRASVFSPRHSASQAGIHSGV